MTGLYNLLEARRSEAALSESEHEIMMRGHILILRDLHNQIDILAMQAYGWSETLKDENIINHLVMLNQLRTAEKQHGLIRWLRPDYQIEN